MEIDCKINTCRYNALGKCVLLNVLGAIESAIIHEDSKGAPDDTLNSRLLNAALSLEQVCEQYRTDSELYRIIENNTH